MPPIHRQQQKIISDFIQISRKEFGLSRRRSGFKASLRRTCCNLLVIAGSIFSALSAPSYADDTQTEATVIERMP